jgi:hypothetical protein
MRGVEGSGQGFKGHPRLDRLIANREGALATCVVATLALWRVSDCPARALACQKRPLGRERTGNFRLFLVSLSLDEVLIFENPSSQVAMAG